MPGCSNCGKRVSKKARRCPNCGEDWPGYSKKIKTIRNVSIGVLFVLVLVVCFYIGK